MTAWQDDRLSALEGEQVAALWAFPEWDAVIEPREADLPLYRALVRLGYVEGRKEAGKRYADTGTVAKSEMLARVHPDVARVAWRFKRVHHIVDYGRFKGLQLRFREGYTPPEGVDNFGMVLRQTEQGPEPQSGAGA